MNRWLLPVLGRAAIITSLAVSVVGVNLLGDRRFILSDLGVFGFVLLFAGISLDIVGRLTLRRFYSETVRIRPDHKLITHGPYRFVRHPIYLGSLLYVFSAPLILLSLLGLVVMAAPIAMFIQRIKLEERVMASALGQDDTEYARKTKRLIPYIY